MSALPPKADIAERDRDVRFVPKADIVRCGERRRYSITSSAWASRVAGTLRVGCVSAQTWLVLEPAVGRPLAFENAIDMFATPRRNVSNK
jgi:hypothetical protein